MVSFIHDVYSFILLPIQYGTHYTISKLDWYFEFDAEAAAQR